METPNHKKILYIEPHTTDCLNQFHEEYFNRNALPGFKVEVRNIEYGGEIQTCSYYFSISIPFIIEEVIKAQKEGFGCAIIGCFGNPGVREAREVVNIPVVGPGEACVHLACQLGERLSILIAGALIHHNDMKLSERYFHQYYAAVIREMRLLGLSEKIVSVRATGSPVVESVCAFAGPDADDEYKLLREQGIKAIEEDGADVLILGCTGMTGISEKMQQELYVPVVDSTLVSLKLAETLINLNLSHSKLSYPFTNVGAEKGLIHYPFGLKGYHGHINTE